MTRREPPYWPHRCPTCSRYVGNVLAVANDERLLQVTGVCKTHGPVHLKGESWNWDLFYGEGDAA